MDSFLLIIQITTSPLHPTGFTLRDTTQNSIHDIPIKLKPITSIIPNVCLFIRPSSKTFSETREFLGCYSRWLSQILVKIPLTKKHIFLFLAVYMLEIVLLLMDVLVLVFNRNILIHTPRFFLVA